jgi:hypothetical protein
MREVFDLLSRIQQRTGLNLLIIGGWALHAHGFSRNTNDVDCMTAITDDAVIGQELVRAGFECFAELPSFRRFRHRLEHCIVLDVMRVDAATFAKVWDGARKFEIEGFTLHVPSLPHLIALKVHAARSENRTDQDMLDVINLLRVNPGGISSVALREICDRFGTPQLTARLAEFL